MNFFSQYDSQVTDIWIKEVPHSTIILSQDYVISCLLLFTILSKKAISFSRLKKQNCSKSIVFQANKNWLLSDIPVFLS